MPRMFILSGCNGSGKTTASYMVLPELFECSEFVNSDEFAKTFSPFDPSAASVSASRYMVLRIRYLLSRRKDFSVETTLATRSLVGIIQQAKELGYTVTVLYFWLESPDLAVSRVAKRVAAGGHNIPEDVIRRRYNMGIKYLFNTYIPICDRWVLADNSKSPFKVVAEGGKTEMFVKDAEKYRLIKQIVDSSDNE